MAILSNLDPLSIYFNAPTIRRFGGNPKINVEVPDP